VLWKQMGNIDLKTGKIHPCYRTKSVKKTVNEILYLNQKYNRKTFCWVDPTWNVDPKWNNEFSKELVKSGVDVDHSVWMRADYVVRDENLGILKNEVKAGVKQAMIGVERTDNDDLNYFEKANYSFETTKKAFRILKKYPSVLSIATYIYGVPDESRQSLSRFYKLLSQIPFDIGVPIPLTPNPGTKYFEELESRKLLEIKDFSYYNFANPVSRSKYLSKNQLLIEMIKNEFLIRAKREQLDRLNISNVFRRRRAATKNLAFSKQKMTFRFAKGIMQEWLTGKVYNYNIRPKWYGS